MALWGGGGEAIELGGDPDGVSLCKKLVLSSPSSSARAPTMLSSRVTHTTLRLSFVLGHLRSIRDMIVNRSYGFIYNHDEVFTQREKTMYLRFQNIYY